jgi:hypothetical protein
MKHSHMYITYAFSVTWAAGATNWRGGGGPVRQSQQARRAMVEANPRGPERATTRASEARGGARSERCGQGARSGPSADGRPIVALPLKTVHDEILAQC